MPDLDECGIGIDEHTNACFREPGTQRINAADIKKDIGCRSDFNDSIATGTEPL
jgi:hypothetical protein